MKKVDPLRQHLADLLDWKSAHVNYDAAVSGVTKKYRGMRTDEFEHSLWQLVEHIRLAQRDILEYCTLPDYAEKKWPDDYWPSNPEPAGDASWTKSIDAFHRDLASLKKLVSDESIDLLACIPGTSHTYLREVLLVADHNAYHVGQIVALRRMLAIWPAG